MGGTDDDKENPGKETPSGIDAAWEGLGSLGTGAGKLLGVTGDLVQQAVLFVSFDEKSAIWKGFDKIKIFCKEQYYKMTTGEPLDFPDLYQNIGPNPFVIRGKYATDAWLSHQKRLILKKAREDIYNDPAYKANLAETVTILERIKYIEARSTFDMNNRNALLIKRKALVDRLNSNHPQYDTMNGVKVSPKVAKYFPHLANSGNSGNIQAEIDQIDKELAQFTYIFTFEDTITVKQYDKATKTTSDVTKKINLKNRLDELKHDQDFYNQNRLLALYSAEIDKHNKIIAGAKLMDPRMVSAATSTDVISTTTPGGTTGGAPAPKTAPVSPRAGAI